MSRRQKSSYIYLLALAAADILVLLLVVFVDFLLEDFLLRWRLPEAIRDVVQALEFWALHTSVWVAVPLTVDRYVAVCHPLRYPSISYPARTRRVIAAVYVGCLLTAAPYLWWPDLWHGLSAVGGRGTGSPRGANESEVLPGATVGQHALVWTHCLTVYAAPCSVFFALNAAIVRRLRSRAHSHSHGRLRLRGLATGRTTAILLAVTSMFAILWAPRTALLLYRLYSPQHESPHSVHLLHLLADVANMLALLNTGVNFFLYCFISKRFRAVAASALRALPRCRPPPPPFYAGHVISASSSPWISPANSQRVRMFVYQYDKHGRPVCISS